jgi:hypothetical protein
MNTKVSQAKSDLNLMTNLGKALEIEKDIFDMHQKMKEKAMALEKQGVPLHVPISQQPIVSYLSQINRMVRLAA